MMLVLLPRALACGLGVLLLLQPVAAWYKHAASPRYHTVGRASGLLMGIRRSPYLWRRELELGLPQRVSDRSGALRLWRRLRSAGTREGSVELRAEPVPSVGPGRGLFLRTGLAAALRCD